MVLSEHPNPIHRKTKKGVLLLMSKYTVKELWEERYGKSEEEYDYAGRRMLKSACGNLNSNYAPTIDHIRPISKDGKDVKGNIEICNVDTNYEKGDTFATWNTNGRCFHAKRVKGSSTNYVIEEVFN